MRTSRRISATLVSIGLAAVAVAGPAQAASNPHTPKSVCGGGFGVVDSAALVDPGKTHIPDDSLTLGRVYLLYNASTKQNCVTTIKAVGVGRKSFTDGFLQRKGSGTKHDRGSFAYYAGPVKVRAPGKCVRWGGYIKVGRAAARYDSDAFEHCG